MTEWSVVGILITLVGLIAAFVGPITKLTQSITKLTVVVDRLDAEQKTQRQDAKTSHKALWEHNHEQDELLGRYDRRITVLEQRHSMAEGGRPC